MHSTKAENKKDFFIGDRTGKEGRGDFCDNFHTRKYEVKVVDREKRGIRKMCAINYESTQNY